MIFKQKIFVLFVSPDTHECEKDHLMILLLEM